MSGQGTKTSEKRFAVYLEGLASVVGHADWKAPLRDYCVGLVACGGRKRVGPMAAMTVAERTAAQHQSLLHFVGGGAWSNEKVLGKVREMVLPAIERQGPIEALDHRRYRISQAGATFSWSCTATLRAARQA